MTATRERKLSRTYHTDHVSVTFPDGSGVTINPGDFSSEIQTTAMLRGLANRLCQGVETSEDFHANADQLKSGIWADKAKGPSEVTQVIAAYLQLNEEQNIKLRAEGKKVKDLTDKAATAMVKAKMEADPSFAINKMADAKFRDAFARSQSGSEKVSDLDAIG